MSVRRLVAPVFLLLALIAPPAAAQLSGTVFDDRDGDGIRDPGEPALSGVSVALLGSPDAGGVEDSSLVTGADGVFSFAPGNGCFMLLPADPAGWRMSQIREEGYPEGSAPFGMPVSQLRFAKLDHGIANLKAGEVRYITIGDSIAWNFNLCGYPESFWYSLRHRDRLACVAPSANVTLDLNGDGTDVGEAAVKGEHTDDLLVDESDDNNNVFRVLELQPDLISISIIGNDLLDAEPSGTPDQQAINRAVAEVIDSRQNLQEVLSTLTTELPDADIVLNTLYDNEAYNCYTGSPSDFHRTWIPILGRILRDIAWGQERRVSNAEVAAEFAREDQLGNCTGYDGLICRDLFGLDNIHPTNDGFDVALEKVWEGSGGVSLGPNDVLNRSSISGADYGYLRRVRRLLPTRWQTTNGASAGNAEAALSDQDGGAPAAITLGAGSEEFRLGGFPDWYDEIQIVRVVAGVRYRTNGVVADDFYRAEASVTGQFRPLAGHAYTPTDWNFYTPIVGGGGPNQPPENPDYPDAKVLARPDVAAYRQPSALLTKNPALPPDAADYEWPAITHAELATTEVRFVSAPVFATTGNDAYQVELDYAWLDLYGWEKSRPAPVEGLRAVRLADGTLEVSFDALTAAQRYNVYFGSLDALRSGSYDHGTAAVAPALCGAATSDAGNGRLKVSVAAVDQPTMDAYILVTAHVDDVESPAGYDAGGVEIDRSQLACY